MPRVLHLSSVQPDFQAERGVGTIAAAMRGEMQIERRTIGRGGDWRSLPFAWFGLRFDRKRNGDILHAWDEIGLRAALAAPGKPIVYSPSALPGKREIIRLA